MQIYSEDFEVVWSDMNFAMIRDTWTHKNASITTQTTYF